MTLTFDDVVQNPEKFEFLFNIENKNLLLRPLKTSDLDRLIHFIDCLSAETKTFYSFTQPSKTIAQEICDAINKYDKLRFVMENEDNDIIGMFEFSFDIPPNDIERFKNYKIDLTSASDCRLGPILLDSYQGKGIGTKVLGFLKEIAISFGQKRIILWGGVHSNNLRAIKFYEKNGFEKLGSFANKDGVECFDMILDLDKNSQ